MAETVNVIIRLDRDIKEQAEKMFGDFGMDLSTALNIFARQSLRQGKIPFEIYGTPYRAANEAKANPGLIPLKKDAWAKAMEEKYEDAWTKAMEEKYADC